MSEKRETKEISLDIKKDDVKDISLSVEKAKNTKPAGKKLTKEDYLNAPTPEVEKKKPIDSSIYARKKAKSKK
jgi:hypothetical protein